MKKIIPHTYLLFIFSALLMLSCTKSGEFIDDTYPRPLIYWTGSGEALTIPSSGIPNYRVDEEEGKIYITLGLSRSGISERGAFTVNIVPDQDTVQQLLQNGGLPEGTIALDPAAYSVPSSVEVRAEEDGGLLEVVLDMNELSEIDREILALALRLSAPSEYAVNPKLETKLMLINYRSVVGIACPVDEAMPGRIFQTFPDQEAVNTWEYGGLAPDFNGPDRMTITRNNDDGYGIAVKWGQTYNVDEYPVWAMRVYDTPDNGGWLIKFFDGSADYVLRPENGSFKELADGSRIYYWNVPEITGLSGEVSSNFQIVIEGPRDQSLSYGWLKSFAETEIIEQCIEE